MNRILFAAARGARIQQPYPEAGGWFNSCDYFFWGDEGFYRIHPDDAHLQYGPVSSALREAAEDGSAWDLTSEAWQMASVALKFRGGCWFAEEELPRSLFLLLLSESLADEGL